MDISTIAKENARLTQQSVNNLFDTFTLLQDHAERTFWYWKNKMSPNKNMQTSVDQFWATVKRGCLDARKLTNECFTNMEVYFSGLDSKPGE